jgi:hypothetical protein
MNYRQDFEGLTKLDSVITGYNLRSGNCTAYGQLQCRWPGTTPYWIFHDLLMWGLSLPETTRYPGGEPIVASTLLQVIDLGSPYTK